MEVSWQKTKSLFTQIIKEPPLKEKFLKRPSPKYIFELVMNTMKSTGFPKGLFTIEEQSIDYFMANVDHKRAFFRKLIDITQLVTKKNCNINIEDILKGLEGEKTNIFLQDFYTAATSDIDKRAIINIYYNEKKNNIAAMKINNFFTNLNIQETNTETENSKTTYIGGNRYKIQSIKEKINLNINKNIIIDNKSEGFIFCIDKNINNNENILYLKYIMDNPTYKPLSSLQLLFFDNLDDVFQLILNYIEFKLIFIIISWELYPYYFIRIKNFRNYIKCLPISIIFTSEENEKKLSQRKNLENIDEEIYNSINNSFYNLGGISSNYNYCINFIFNFYINIHNKFKINKLPKESYDGCLTFECIYSEKQLILPFLYNELMSEEIASENEIQNFKNFLLINHREDAIVKLILPMLYIKDIPHEIISKFFIRAYTEQTSFYSEMNKLLMKQKGKDYNTFIKVMFEGLFKKSFSISEDDLLYRGSKMSRKEIDNIINLFENWKKNKNNSLPSFLLYSRCFLSFSKDQNIVKDFIGNTDDNFYGILFILKNNIYIPNKFSANADIETLSNFNEEREVLFFPFTSFALENIYKGIFKDKFCIIINLEYLGRYEFIFNNIKNNENFKNTFIDNFNNQNYAKELIKSNFFKRKDRDEKKEILEKIKKKLIQKYDIELTEGMNKEKVYEKEMLVINVDENIQNPYFFVKEKEEIKIDTTTLENIRKENRKITKKEKEVKEEKNNVFFLTSLILNKTEYIWMGESKSGKKHGKGKEFDFDNNIVYEGEYENGNRKLGVEYYIIGTKKFEGEYKNGKRWNGFIYDSNMTNKYELICGNGFIKEFHENGALSFEGEIKDGEKNGKGKIFNECGHLIYEGNLYNGIKNGLGKLYNDCGDLIFEGYFGNGKQMKGTIYKYNNRCELIYKKTEKELIMFETLFSYTHHSMINYGLWIMKKEGCNNKKETTFERDYENEKIYRGKEYNNKGELIFEGEFLNQSSEEKYINPKMKKNIRKKGKEYNYRGNLIFEGEFKMVKNIVEIYLILLIMKYQGNY